MDETWLMAADTEAAKMTGIGWSARIGCSQKKIFECGPNAISRTHRPSHMPRRTCCLVFSFSF